MQSTEDSLCGLIEFEPEEARLALRGRDGSDETLHATLLSIAQDLLPENFTEVDADEWRCESVVIADYEQLSHDLLLIYQRIERKLR